MPRSEGSATDMRIIASLAALLFLGLSLPAAPPAARQAPDIAFTVPGQGQRKLSDYLGKVVALEFIYTTCTHCQASARSMQKLQQDLGPQGFQAIEIAFNPNAEVLTDDFTKNQHLTLPVGWAVGNDVTSFLGYGPADRFVVPQIVLIDRAGVIRHQTRAQGADDLRSEPILRQRIMGMVRPVNAPKPAAPTKPPAPR
jgi:peroxiredoxin